MEKRDVIIIGAGIAGMTAAIYLKRFNVDVLVLEKGIPGGQLNNTRNLKNYPGFLEKDGTLLAEHIFKQVQELNIDYVNEAVEEVVINDKKIVKTKTKEYECNQLIIATGRAPRVLKAKGEDKLLGHGISYCAVCDGYFFKDKDVIIVGGSASALEDTLYLAKTARKCYIICRKPFLKGEDMNIKEVESLANVEVVYNANVKEFVGDEFLTSVVLDVDGTERTLDVAGAFISIGYEPNFSVNSAIELENEKGYLKVNKNGETNIEGVFAVGDAIDKDLYQLTTAAGEAAIAANYIKKTYYK